MSSRSRTNAPVLRDRIATEPVGGHGPPRGPHLSEPGRNAPAPAGFTPLRCSRTRGNPPPLAPQVLVRARKTSWKRSCADPVLAEIDGKKLRLGGQTIWCLRRRQLAGGSSGSALRDVRGATQRSRRSCRGGLAQRRGSAKLSGRIPKLNRRISAPPEPRARVHHSGFPALILVEFDLLSTSNLSGICADGAPDAAPAVAPSVRTLSHSSPPSTFLKDKK